MGRRFLNIAQIRHIEADAVTKCHLDLIDEAGICIANWVKHNFVKSQKILVLVGRGNNGGDGVSAAIKLKELGYNVSVFAVGSSLNPTTEKLITTFVKAGGKVLPKLLAKLDGYALIIDAILGIGVHGVLDTKLIQLIDLVNQSDQFILSIDTPTGLDPFSGEVYGNAICANHTITFISDKPGFYTGHGLDLVGGVTVETLVDLGKCTLPKPAITEVLPNDLDLINYQGLTRKRQNTNKGTFGTVAIIGGNKGMHGALYLAARAAMLLGSGKVVMASLDDDFAQDMLMPELMLQSPKDILKNLDKYSVVVVGPGLGDNLRALRFLSKIITQAEQTKLIFDADALNLIAKHSELHEEFKAISNKIITPHPGEAARMLKTTVAGVQQNRFAVINNLTMRFNALVLLKGAGSLIQDKSHVYLNQTGNTALASGGQGDTLCGIIAAFIAQGLDLSTALRFAVYLHGKSAESLVSSIGYNGVLATEVALTSRNLLNQLLYS